jgi:hypothetical protein
MSQKTPTQHQRSSKKAVFTNVAKNKFCITSEWIVVKIALENLPIGETCTTANGDSFIDAIRESSEGYCIQYFDSTTKLLMEHVPNTVSQEKVISAFEAFHFQRTWQKDITWSESTWNTDGETPSLATPLGIHESIKRGFKQAIDYILASNDPALAKYAALSSARDLWFPLVTGSADESEATKLWLRENFAIAANAVEAEAAERTKLILESENVESNAQSGNDARSDYIPQASDVSGTSTKPRNWQDQFPSEQRVSVGKLIGLAITTLVIVWFFRSCQNFGNDASRLPPVDRTQIGNKTTIGCPSELGIRNIMDSAAIGDGAVAAAMLGNSCTRLYSGLKVDILRDNGAFVLVKERDAQRQYWVVDEVAFSRSNPP